MSSQPNARFFQIQQISENSTIFEQLENQQLFFSYFQIEQNYYLFFYEQESIDMDLIDPSIEILEELNTKQRRILYIRGLFIYVSEIMENGKDLQFLFGTNDRQQSSSPDLEAQVQILQNQVLTLQERVSDLETKLIKKE